MTNLLLNIIENRRLDLTLFKSIITWKKNTQFSIIDLMFMSKNLREIFVTCETKNNLNQSSNHIFIIITLQMKSEKTKIEKKNIWKSLNVENLKAIFLKKLLQRRLNFCETINAYLNKLIINLNKVINDSVSWSRLFNKTKLF